MHKNLWPNGAQAAISFTVDNLGEAQEINAGIWPKDEPVGKHFAAVDIVPQMLDTFDACGIKATFFFETWSANIYPQIVNGVIDRGHEIGWHGWQHEPWSKLSPEQEQQNFTRSFTLAEKLGLSYQGFRPPGGLINLSTYELMRRHGIRYISPAAQRVANVDGLAVLPFQWNTIDAYFYMDEFSKLRQNHGDPAEALTPDDLKTSFLQKVEEAINSNGYISFLFHPFLQTSAEKLRTMKEIVEQVAKDDRVWCAPCTEVADWVSQKSTSFDSDPLFITDTW